MNSKSQKFTSLNGAGIIISMFRSLSQEKRRDFLTHLSKASPILVKLALDHEFIFEDLLLLDNRSIQKALVEVPEIDWIMIWPLCRAEIKERLLENMSERKKSTFQKELRTNKPLLRVQIAKIKLKIGRVILAKVRAKEYRLASTVSNI